MREEKQMADPYRLRLHAMPPTGWMNDPNGFCWFEGAYHLFYQCSPFSPESGLKYWGHMTSTNLLEWNHLPIALAPDCDYDRDGCYSGGAITKDGTLWLMYTGHVCGKAVDSREAEDSGEAVDGKEAVGSGGVRAIAEGTAAETQNLAFSRDGVIFEKYRGNPVIRPHQEPDPDFRDPFVWEQDGQFYCLVGSRKENHGRVLLYESRDLLQWHFKSVLLEGAEDMGFMWECPGLLSFPEGDVLFLSVEGKDGIRHSTWYLSGRLDLGQGVFEVKRTERLDYGRSFYAPQVLAHGDERLLVGWMDRWFSQMPSKKWGWAGAMSIPRTLTLGNDGLLRMLPVKGISGLPGRSCERLDLRVLPGATFVLPDSAAEVFLLELWISRGKSGCASFSVRVKRGEEGEAYPGVEVDLERGRLTVELDLCRETAPLFGPEGDCLQVIILADRSSLEVFADQGRVCAANRIYPHRKSLGLELGAEGGVLWIERLSLWQPVENL